MTDEDRYMSTRQVCEYTTLAYGTLANMRTQKIGPKYYKVGGRVIYKKSDVDAWINAETDRMEK